MHAKRKNSWRFPPADPRDRAMVDAIREILGFAPLYESEAAPAWRRFFTRYPERVE